VDTTPPTGGTAVTLLAPDPVRSTPPAPAPAPASSVAVAAAVAPGGRDLTVDLLRALAIVLVVAGHWLVVVPAYGDGRFGGVNALATVPLTRALTWGFQVMPLFFAIGGYAGAVSWCSARARAGGNGAAAYPVWLGARLRRLLAPTLVLLAGWAGVCAALRAAGVDGEAVRAIGALVVVPVWFLSVFVVVTALVPVSVAAHRAAPERGRRRRSLTPQRGELAMARSSDHGNEGSG
jgi:hypothetical protein